MRRLRFKHRMSDQTPTTPPSSSSSGSDTKQTGGSKVNLKNLPDLMTINEVSELLRVSKLTLKRWEKRGKIRAIRINSRGDRRYRKEAVLSAIGLTWEQ